METKNKKLRLIVTAECNNNCPMCRNKALDIENIPVVDRWDYEEVMVTGGEPMLSLDDLVNLCKAIKQLNSYSGIASRIYLYTSCADLENLSYMMLYTDGVVLTPHNKIEIYDFIYLNQLMTERNIHYKIPFRGKSLRLNIFPEVKKFLPENIDLSPWKVKEIQWTKDCPVPEGEDLRRIKDLWKPQEY